MAKQIKVLSGVFTDESDVTLYTVPVGRVAKVTLAMFALTGGSGGSSVSLVFGGKPWIKSSAAFITVPAVLTGGSGVVTVSPGVLLGGVNDGASESGRVTDASKLIVVPESVYLNAGESLVIDVAFVGGSKTGKYNFLVVEEF